MRAEEACELLCEAVKRRPNDQLCTELGITMRRLGCIREAVLEFQVALALNPENDAARQVGGLHVTLTVS